MISVSLLAGCSLTPTEVEPINGVKTYSITSNRVANMSTGNPNTVEEALWQLESRAVPAYMKDVCGSGGHKIVSASKPNVKPWTGGGGGWLVERTFLAQCK